MYRIAWASLVEPHEGVNDTLYPLEEAESICIRLNAQYAGRITHWVVQAIERMAGEAFAGCC
jgi:hypothetical protein